MGYARLQQQTASIVSGPYHCRRGLLLQEQFGAGVWIVQAAVLHVAIQEPRLIVLGV